MLVHNVNYLMATQEVTWSDILLGTKLARSVMSRFNTNQLTLREIVELANYFGVSAEDLQNKDLTQQDSKDDTEAELGVINTLLTYVHDNVLFWQVLKDNSYVLNIIKRALNTNIVYTKCVKNTDSIGTINLALYEESSLFCVLDDIIAVLLCDTVHEPNLYLISIQTNAIINCTRFSSHINKLYATVKNHTELCKNDYKVVSGVLCDFMKNRNLK